MILILLFAGSGTAFWIKTTVNAKNSNDAGRKFFVIKEGQGLETIAKKLEAAGLVKNFFVFELYLKAAGKSGGILAGEYEIPRNLNMKELSEILTRGQNSARKITIPEGWTTKQIAEYLQKNNIVSESDFLAVAKYDPQKYQKYAFLKDLKTGEGLEGFLYPDTYEISKKATSEEIIGKMLDNFDSKFNDVLRDKAQNSNMTIPEIVTLASIVEREVAKSADRRIVAGIFLNRLNTGVALESCATIQYILGTNKTNLTTEDTHIKSPYNTYLNTGLPPGPIGNPSMDSIEAVLYPEKTSYFYFLSAKGKTYFSKTLEEHNAKKALYL